MSKYVLVCVENHDILEPDIYDTYDEAFDAMSTEVLRLSCNGDDIAVHHDYACIQSDCNRWDWRIIEVKC